MTFLHSLRLQELNISLKAHLHRTKRYQSDKKQFAILLPAVTLKGHMSFP